MIRFAIPTLALAAMALLTPALADGRADWTGYDWHDTPFGECIAVGDLGCHALHAKWDWKRDQWVDFWYAPASDRIDLDVTLTNNALHDSDYVCVTAMFLDAAGANLAVWHVNLHSDPQTVTGARDRLSLPKSAEVARVEIGTKQCRDGASQDDDIYAAVRAALSD